MTAILRLVPFTDTNDELHVGSERVQIKPYQLVTWVSVAVWRTLELRPQTPRFPAIIDTGHNHNFSIRAEHLRSWAGLGVETVGKIGAVRIGGQRVHLHGAHVWIHATLPGQRHQLAPSPPHRLFLEEGVAVYPEGSVFPSLPTLGMRALVRNKLHLTLDPERYVFNLRTPDWQTKLARWLT